MHGEDSKLNYILAIACLLQTILSVIKKEILILLNRDRF